MVLTVGGDRFLSSELSSIYAKLCADPHEAILKTIASGFHEVYVRSILDVQFVCILSTVIGADSTERIDSNLLTFCIILCASLFR